MSSAPGPEEIARDARWLAQALDPSAGMVRLVAMSPESYRAASFLDDRLLQQPVDAQLVAWVEIERAVAAELRRDARWIFHIGHVGSTLVSRLLGELNGVLAVREPRLLRDLALSPSQVRAAYLSAVPKLMSRTFGPGEAACVKVTSFASEIAPDLAGAGSRLLMMYATPRNYIASILAGENSVKEMHMLADHRAQRMADRVRGLDAATASDAHLAAAAWACEMTSLEAASDKIGDQSAEWSDFDQMLQRPGAELGRIADHFGFEADEGRIETICAGPLMKRYSKALEYDYSPALRRELIAEATQHHRRDIDSALAMLHSAAETSPLLARALARAEG